MISPTNLMAISPSTKRSISPASPIGKRSRAKRIPPRIFVQLDGDWMGHLYARAHLRNKGRYVYLCWRDHGKIRTFYLGKKRNSSPTACRRPGPGAG